MPPGYRPPEQPGVAAGNSNIIRARQVIIVGTGGEVLVYSPAQAASDLIASIAGAAFTDQPGNQGLAGVADYSNSGGVAVQLANGGIAFYGGSLAGGWTQQSTISGPVNLQVNAATGQLQLVGSSGVAVTGAFTVNGNTKVQNGDNGGVTSGPSGTVNAFPAAGPNHTHAEVHRHAY